MLRLIPGSLLICAGAALLAGCGRGEPAASGAAAAGGGSGSPPIQEVMANAFTPQSNLLWELGGKLYDDEGNIVASLLNEPEWATMEKTASEMRAAAVALQTAPRRVVAAPGVTIQGDGGPGALGAAQIQALIDSQPQQFAEEAGKLVEVADGYLAAIKARDGNAIDELSGRLNEACSSCHMRFWYPEQAAQ